MMNEKDSVNQIINTPLRIYLAGPYTAATLAGKTANVKKAIDVGIVLYLRGHYPLIPHLSHFIDLEAKSRGTPLGWSEYMSTDIAWLRFADAMFFIGPSPGANVEYKEAKKHDMKIYYDIAKVPFIPYEDREVAWEDNNSYFKDLQLDQNRKAYIPLTP